MKLELSDMLANAKSDPPPLRYSVEDAIAAGRKRQRRLRTTWAGAGSAAVAAVAVIAAVVTPQIISDRRPAAPAPVAPAASPAATTGARAFEYPANEFTGNIASFSAGGLTVSGTVQVTPGYQVAVVVAPGRGTPITDSAGAKHQRPNDVGQLVVYRAGVFDPVDVETGEKVTVNGHPGYYSQNPPVTQPTPSNVNVPVQTPVFDATLAWEYADNAWAVVYTNPGTKITEQQLIAVANGVASGTQAPTKVGLSLGYVPRGFRLAAAGTSDSRLLSPFDGESYIRLLKGDFPYAGLTAPVQDPFVVQGKQLPFIQIAVYPRWYGEYPVRSGKVAGSPFCSTAKLCFRVSSDGRYGFELSGGGGVSEIDLLKMLQSVTVADPTDAGTWLNATDVVR